MARQKKKQKLADLPGQPDPRAPLDSALFLSAAQPVLKLLDADLLKRAKDSPAITVALKARHAEEKAAERTADGFAVWQRNFIEQVSAAWLLSCVFARALEDRGLLSRNRIAGPGAADAQRLFLSLAPSLTERDYLLTVFRELSQYPAAKDLFGPRHNPVWLLAPSADAAKTLLALFRTPSADEPAFRFGVSDTRYLGDLYQDLNENVRKRYALLQTPDFIEEFILDRTLEPAIEKFGLDDTDLIDPTCGSGHFLLGAFDRFFDHLRRAKPAATGRQAAAEALDKVYGADINPFAVAIAKFRLTLSFLDKGGYERLGDAPVLPLHVAVADSLLYNPQHEQGALFHQEGADAAAWEKRAFDFEDEAEARAVLHRQFAAVVGNPPYITVKDSALRTYYRQKYLSAVHKYSLAAPFTERFFQLARAGGFAGTIVANSFMKREFGKPLIEEFLSGKNVTLIINAVGAYIPGHGTPTLILFGTNEAPRGSSIRTLLSIRNEPDTPLVPENGLVWRSIADHWQEEGFQNEFVSVANLERDTLSRHPWSLEGGAAPSLAQSIDSLWKGRLSELTEDIGFAAFPGLDEPFLLPDSSAAAARLEPEVLRPMIRGDSVRDWTLTSRQVALAPYDKQSHEPLAFDAATHWGRHLWPFRTALGSVRSFGGKTRLQEARPWWHWYRWQPGRLRLPMRLVYACVATHNHFALETGCHGFNSKAPIVILRADSPPETWNGVLAFLSSSLASFLIKRVSHLKTNHADGRPETGEPGTLYYDIAGRSLGGIPVPDSRTLESLAPFGVQGNRLAKELDGISPSATAVNLLADTEGWCAALARAESRRRVVQGRLVALQEDLDWAVYGHALLCRKEAATAVAESWELEPPNRLFLGGAAPELDAKSREVWAARRGALDASEELMLLEDAEHKRRWIPGGRGSFATSARSFEEDCRLEVRFRTVHLIGATMDVPLDAPEFARAAESRMGRSLFEWAFSSGDDGSMPESVLEGTAIPFVGPRYLHEGGVEKLRGWELLWRRQADEDRGQRSSDGSGVPMFTKSDYREARYYRLRGKLGVPCEGLISYPGCDSDENRRPVYGWAGWDHEQRAKALATLYYRRKTDEGWDKDRLTPMLAGLLELQFWLELWHGEKSDDYGGISPAEYYLSFLNGECQALGLTHDDLRAWRPAEKVRKKRATKKRAADASEDEA